MEGNVSSPKVLVKARKIWSNPLEDDQILIPRLTEWCFADMGAPAIDEGEVNLESKRVTTPGEGAGLPARLRPIVWRNVGKHVTKSEGWKTLLKAHTRHVAQTVVAVAGRSSEPLLAKGDEVTGREDRLQRSQGGSSGAEDLPAGGVKTGKESDEAAAPPDLREDNPMPSGDPADEQVPERVEAMMEGGVANLPAKGDGRQSKADACGRQEEACGRQSLVGSSWESDGQGPKSNGCRPETDGGGRRPAATLSSPRNTGKPSSVQKAGVLGVNPSLDPSQPGGHGRGPKSASEQGEDDAELQQPGVLLALSPTSEADLLRGPELGHGFGSSRRLSSEEELCRIAPNSASSPTAESPASGYETLKCFNALLAKLRTGDLLPQTGPSCTQETWDKENVCGAWEGSCEPGRLVANEASQRGTCPAIPIHVSAALGLSQTWEAKKTRVVLASTAYTEITLVDAPRGGLQSAAAVPPMCESPFEDTPAVKGPVLWSPKTRVAKPASCRAPPARTADVTRTESDVAGRRALLKPSGEEESEAELGRAVLEGSGAVLGQAPRIGEAEVNGARSRKGHPGSLDQQEVLQDAGAAAPTQREADQTQGKQHGSPSEQQRGGIASFRSRKLPPRRREPGLWRSTAPSPTALPTTEPLPAPPVDDSLSWLSAVGSLLPIAPFDLVTCGARQHQEPLTPVHIPSQAVEKSSGSYWQQFPGLGEDRLRVLREWPEKSLEWRTEVDTGEEGWKAFDDSGLSEVLMGISENTPRLLPVRTEAELPVRIFDERHWQSQPELQQSRATGAFRRQRSKQGEIGGGFKFGAEVGDGSESKRRRIDSRGTVHMVEEEAHRKDMRGGFAACVTRFAKGFVNPDG